MQLFVVPTLVSNAFVVYTLREVQRTDATGVSGRDVGLEWHALKLAVQPLTVASLLLHHLAFIVPVLPLCFRARLLILRSHLRRLPRHVRCRYRSMRFSRPS